MKLLVVCERLGQLGGMERYLELTLPALAKAGHDVTVVAASLRAQVDGVAAHGVPWSDEHDEPDRAAALHLASIARDVRPDVVVAHNVLDAAVLGAARDGAPRLVYHLHDHRPFCPNGDRVFPRGGATCTLPMGGACAWNALVRGCAYGPRARTRALIDVRDRVRRAVLRADAVVAFSQFVASLARTNGIAAERLHVVDPPVADVAFAQTVSPAPSRPTVLFLGRVVPQKGLGALVRAIARIAATRRPLLRVVGDGPALSDARKQALRCGVEMDELGSRAPDAIPAAIDDATIVAVPSLWAEPFGLVGAEAHARGRPVVAFRSGGIPEWLTPFDVGVAPGDERALSLAIERLAEPNAWGIASRAARASADRYDLATHVRAIARVYGAT